ncbi:hypothetical protein PR048_000900 [Dryococelus australis]|uniref:Reverse transcriptase domain-containing protein n=1 Tax=Dryococelus australis TaxID=614101 RepID=A0ABQ9IFV1_9NEOP|nr:hypothetical protein PR048_000900 [Dryococelus australis]
MTTLDLRNRYWQAPIKPADRHKTAFTASDRRRFQFCAMPFVLKCAPAMFQVMVVRVLDGYVGDFTLVCLDCVITWSEDWEQHINYLSLILECLAINKFTCTNCKYHIDKQYIQFLGNLVDDEGSTSMPKQLALINHHEPQCTCKQM